MKYAILILTALTLNLATASAKTISFDEWVKREQEMTRNAQNNRASEPVENHNAFRCRKLTTDQCFQMLSKEAVVRSDLLKSILKNSYASVRKDAKISAQEITLFGEGGDMWSTYIVYVPVTSDREIALRGLTFRVDIEAMQDQEDDSRLGSVSVTKIQQIKVNADKPCAVARTAFDTAECVN